MFSNSIKGWLLIWTTWFVVVVTILAIAEYASSDEPVKCSTRKVSELHTAEKNYEMCKDKYTKAFNALDVCISGATKYMPVSEHGEFIQEVRDQLK